jgi:hypothetical protein
LSQPQGSVTYRNTWGVLDWTHSLQYLIRIQSVTLSLILTYRVYSAIAATQLQSTVHYGIHLAFTASRPTPILWYRFTTADVPLPGFSNYSLTPTIANHTPFWTASSCLLLTCLQLPPITDSWCRSSLAYIIPGRTEEKPSLAYIVAAMRYCGNNLCEGGIEYRRVVTGDGKETQYPGAYLGHSVPGGYKYGDLPLQVGGDSRIWTIKCGLSPTGLRPERDCAGETSSNSKLHTRPLVREGATE